MKPFETDASGVGSIEKDHLVFTREIKDYARNDEDDHKFFIVGPKGMGKTLLLIYKRNIYSDIHLKIDKKGNVTQEIYFIPKSDPLDRGFGNIPLTDEKIYLLSDHESWAPIWKLSIMLSVFKHIIYLYKRSGVDDLENKLTRLSTKYSLPKAIRELIQDTDIHSPSGHLYKILELNYNDLRKLLSLQPDFWEFLKHIHSAVYIFIDNVDQSFDNYLKNGGDRYQFKGLWAASQIGLAKAIYELTATSRHIKIFASIRTEAFQQMKKETMIGEQIVSSTLDISYTKENLREIFIKNIRMLEKDDLVIPTFLDRDPIYAFLGIKEIRNKWALDKEERIFDYIYRHTLKRPRDFMVMGSYLNKIPPSDRNEENIRSGVNNTAYDIAKWFIPEISPFCDVDDFERLFSIIHSNILKRREITEICKRFNHFEECDATRCSDCSGACVFSDLYKSGLLGIVALNTIKNEYRQSFITLGDELLRHRILPFSEYYLIHPVLTKHILNQRNLNGKNYNMCKTIIIGDGREWHNPNEHKIQRYCNHKNDICQKAISFNESGVFLISSNEYIDFLSKLKTKLENEFKDLEFTAEIEHWKEKENITSGEIFCNEVCPKLYRNKWLLAEVSDFNPNVLFECGFALGLGREVVFLCNSQAKLAKSKLDSYYLEYNDENDIASQLKQHLSQHLDKLNFNRLYSVPRHFDNMQYFDEPNIRTKKGIKIVSFNPEINIIRKLKQEYNCDLLNANKLSLFPDEFVRELINSEAILINLYGRKQSDQKSRYNDAILMFYAGLCCSQGLPIKIFQSNDDFYNDTKKISIRDLTGEIVVDFIQNLRTNYDA